MTIVTSPFRSGVKAGQWIWLALMPHTPQSPPPKKYVTMKNWEKSPHNTDDTTNTSYSAKLLQSLPEEREHIGPHIFNPDDQNIDSLPEAQMENRELFVEFCLEEDYVVSSTMFQKHHNDLITFRNTQAATFASPFMNTRFSQIDHILSKRRWRNAIRNVNATHHTSLESDHKMIVVDVVIKLAKQTKKSTAHAPKYREPSDEQRLKYNQIIRQL